MGCWKKLHVPLMGLLIIIACASELHAEILYKRYYVHSVNGRDLLSEPYKIRPNDYVIKILKQKGEISRTNFPLFLNIFKLINHHIPNINRIHPGERIFVPLKWLKTDALPGQKRGIVDVPFITAAPVRERLAANTTAHRVKPGESVSQLVSQQFGPMGSPAFQEGVKLFRLINPKISDLNHIYIGQRLKIPKAGLLDEPWYASVFQADGEVVLNATKQKESSTKTGRTHYKSEAVHGTLDPFEALTQLLGGVLLNRGRYYFPDTTGGDFSVDLSKTPILQLPEGRRILFIRRDLSLSQAQRKIMADHFKKLCFADTGDQPTLSRLLDAIQESAPEMRLPMPLSFSEAGMTLSLSAHRAFKYDTTHSKASFRGVVISELTHPSQRSALPLVAYLQRYGLTIREALRGKVLPTGYFSPLKNLSLQEITPYTHKVYIQELAKALGLLYDPDVSISFAYAGMQIEATAHMVRQPEGNEALVDFGELYGDAAFAIEQSGLQVISIHKGDYLHTTTLKLLSTLEIPFEENPRIDITEGAAPLTGSLTIDGILTEPSPLVKKLIVAAPLPAEITALLEEKGVGIILIR